jgi:serine/threonine protein kinase
MSGSLKTMLRDQSITLSWHTRLMFACDISRGMSYLHEHEMLHRDLKADNCFVDEKTMRVKVADFGTGHVGARMADKDDVDERKSQRFSVSAVSTSPSLSSVRSRASTSHTSRDESWTMSTGRGSRLWMSPERLREERVTRAEAKAGDVYRYAYRIQLIDCIIILVDEGFLEILSECEQGCIYFYRSEDQVERLSFIDDFKGA